MIGQKLILLTRVQAEINEVVVLYMPVLLLILPCFHYLLVGAACIFFITTFSTLGNLLAEVVKIHDINIKGEKPGTCVIYEAYEQL